MFLSKGAFTNCLEATCRPEAQLLWETRLWGSANHKHGVS